ncbi:MAG TPA: MBL fold metallo-hydrolase [Chloroflexota bacterium]
MKIRFWGTRGSIPAPGPSTIRYGGNTSCVEVRLDDGTLIVLDAGSGIRPLGKSLGAARGTVLLTHYHWDHIQGFPFFDSAYIPGSEFRVFGPEFNNAGPREYLSDQMMAPYFPATVAQMTAISSFQVTPREPFRLGSGLVRATRVSHPSVTLGYRIEADDAVFVYISDNEVDVAPPELIDDIVGLASGADILVHDCQYTEGEYAGKHGWGHSTPRQATRIAREAGVAELVLFHHDPTHNDEQIEGLADEARRLVARSLSISIAHEGEIIDIGAYEDEVIAADIRAEG